MLGDTLDANNYIKEEEVRQDEIQELRERIDEINYESVNQWLSLTSLEQEYVIEMEEYE